MRTVPPPAGHDAEPLPAASVAPESAAVEWSVWTTTARVVVTDPRRLTAAAQLVRDHLAAVDLAASRFRPDSEISLIAASGRTRFRVSPLLADLLRVALDAAAATDGDVDPTLGSALAALGYGNDPADVVEPESATPRPTVVHPTTWRDVHLDGRDLQLPTGTLLDLGATAKARAADHSAELVAHRLGTGVLVGLGGDLRVAGDQPAGSWTVLVQDGDDEPSSSVRLVGARAVATSSTLHRTWRHRGEVMHHVLHPATRRPADAVWRTATVAADTCTRANTLSTACLVRGHDAPDLLRRAGVAARLVAADGTVRRFDGWPA